MLPCLTTYDYDMIKLESTLLDVPYTQVSAHLAIWFLKRRYVKIIFLKYSYYNKHEFTLSKHDSTYVTALIANWGFNIYIQTNVFV